MRISAGGLRRSLIIVLCGLAIGVPTALAEEPPAEPPAGQTLAPAPAPPAPTTGTTVQRGDT